MRILLALDGSPGSTVAHALVASLPWATGTQIDVVRVVEPPYEMLALGGADFVGSIDEIMDTEAVRKEVVASIADLEGPGRTVTTTVETGRPATVITRTAAELGSDLVVLGSRGRGPIATMVLGSVSAEVADTAPCPVLIARKPTCERIVVALDGTPFSARIVETIGDLEIFREIPIDLLTVAPSTIPGPGLLLSGAYTVPIDWYAEAVEETRNALAAVIKDGAEHLTSRGFTAKTSIEGGDPAAKIIEHAERTGADAIVVGTHGRTGVTRLLLGSVARKVLTHAHASVLVLRAQHEDVTTESATAG